LDTRQARKLVLALSAGLIPGRSDLKAVCGLFMMTVGCSEYDQTVKYTILPLPNQEMERQNFSKQPRHTAWNALKHTRATFLLLSV